VTCIRKATRTEVFLGVQQLFLAGSALDDVDRREHAVLILLARRATASRAGATLAADPAGRA
jgi:hypothetical protein